jgi:hypothetical protein
MKDTKNVAESLDDKMLNRSLGITMNIEFGSDHTFKE